MLIILLYIMRFITLGFVIYFCVKIWLTASTLTDEKRMFVPSVSRVIPTFWSYLNAHSELKQKLLGNKTRFASFMDLGAGYGSAVRQGYEEGIADEVSGIEFQFLLSLIARSNLIRTVVEEKLRRFFGRSRRIMPKMHWRRGDFATLDISQYDCLYIFITPLILKSLLPKLKAEARPGTVILSWVFPIEAFQKDEIHHLQMKGIKEQKTLYIYKLSPQLLN